MSTRTKPTIAIRLVLALTLSVGCSDSHERNATNPGTNGKQSLDTGEASANYGPDRTQYDRLFSVIIGIDEYNSESNDLEPLQYAVNDAREIRNVLRYHFGFKDDLSDKSNQHTRHIYLTDGEATASGIKSALAEIAALKPSKHDGFLLFYAGHGLIDNETKDGFITTIESHRRDLSTCVSIAELRDVIASLPCMHKLLILDCCYSGTLFTRFERLADQAGGTSNLAVESNVDGVKAMRSTRRGPADVRESETDPLHDCFRDPCYVGISAGRITPVADGLGDNRHSIFSAALLQELRDRADTGRADQAFTFRQLAARVEARVRDTPGSQQRPDWGRLGPGNGDFVFRPTVLGVTPRERTRRAEYVLRIRQAQQLINEDNTDEAQRLLDSCPVDLRQWEWNYLRRNCGGEIATFPKCRNVLAFSRDATLLATTDDRNGSTVKICDLGRSESRVLVEGHDRDEVSRGRKSAVCSASFSSDGSRLAIGSGSVNGSPNPWPASSIRVVNTNSGLETFAFDCGGKAAIVRFSSDDRYLGALLYSNRTENSEVRIWNAATGGSLLSLSLSQPKRYNGAKACGFSPCGQFFAVAGVGEDGTLIIYDAATAREHAVLRPRNALIEQFAFLPNESALITVNKMLNSGGKLQQFEIVRWDLNSGAQLSVCGVDTTDFNRVSLSAEGKYVLGRHAEAKPGLIVESGPTRVLSVTSGKEVWRMSELAFGGRGGGSFGPQDRCIGFTAASLDLNGSDEIKVWKGEFGEPQAPMTLPNEQFARVSIDSDFDVWTLQFATTKDDNPFGANEAVLKCWRSVPLEEVFSIPAGRPETASVLPTLQKHLAAPNYAVCSAAALVAVAGDGACVEFFDTKYGSRVNGIEAGPGIISKIQFNASGELIVLDLLRFTGGREIAEGLNGAKSEVLSFRREVEVWNRLKERKIFSNAAPNAEFGIDNELIVTARRRDTRTIETYRRREDSYELHQKVILHEPYEANGPTARSPVTGTTAVCGPSGDVTLWDATTSTRVATCRGHKASVKAATFSPDGRRVATAGGNDRTIRLWDAETGSEILSLSVPSRASDVQFSADGRKLAGVSVDDGLVIGLNNPKISIYIWDGARHP